MATRAQTNYQKHKDKLIELVSRGALCYNCLARNACKTICTEKGIDVAKTPAPCTEAWSAWCDSKAE